MVILDFDLDDYDLFGLFHGLNQFMDKLCYDFTVVLVPFSKRFWLFDAAKGGENYNLTS